VSGRRKESVNAKSALAVDCLERCLALGRMWMNVIQHNLVGEGSGDRIETLEDEVRSRSIRDSELGDLARADALLSRDRQ
jgi:hypothetical protein